MTEYRKFLEQLFGNKSDDLNISIYMLPLKAGKFYNTVEHACQYIDDVIKKSQNVFFGCGLVRPNVRHGRGKKDDIGGIGGFWADIDFQSGNKPGYPTDVEAIEKLIYGHGIDPTHLIHTGNGLHAWWVFKEPWEFKSEAEAMHAESLNNRLQETILKRAREKGWSIDKTHDLTRIMRPPGTENKKDFENPLPIKVLKESDSFYADPEAFDEFLISEEELNLIKDPIIDEQVRIEDNLKLDPKAEPPPVKLEELLNIDHNFKGSWNAQRPDFKKQSASEYALSLANYAVQAAWTDQEIANLIIAFYRHHQFNAVFSKKPQISKAMRSDYLSRTIAIARAAVSEKKIEEYYQEIRPSLGTPYEKKLDPEGEEARQRVCEILGLKILYIKQYLALKDTKYLMKASFFDSVEGTTKTKEIYFDSTTQFSDLTRFQNEVFKITKKFRPIKKKFWDGIVKPNWEKFMKVEEVGPQEITSRLRDWFEEYLGKDNGRTVDDATLDKMPFVHKGHWYVHHEHLNTWAMTQGLEKLNSQQTKIDLTVAGCVWQKLNAVNPNTNTRTSVYFFKVPKILSVPPGSRPSLRLIKDKKTTTNEQNDIDETDTDHSEPIVKKG